MARQLVLIDGPTFGTGNPLWDDILFVPGLLTGLPPIQRTKITIDLLDEMRAFGSTGGALQPEIQPVFLGGGIPSYIGQRRRSRQIELSLYRTEIDDRGIDPILVEYLTDRGQRLHRVQFQQTADDEPV